MGKSKYLRLGLWNVNGLKAKLQDSMFVNMLNSYDICVLTETWLTTNVLIDGFYTYCLNAKKISKKSGRHSGGIVILINQKIRKQVKIVEKDTKYGLWLKIDKDTLNLDKHLFIGGIYLPPSDSKYALQEPFEEMERDFSDFLSTGNLIVLEDLNARCANLPDYLMNYNGDIKVGLESMNDKVDYDCRFNCDTVINSYGRKLLQLCANTDMSIINGRVEGDTPGKFTCHKTNGSSVVDYGLISSSIMDQVVYFQVQPPNEWSDHSLIKMCVKLKGFNSGGNSIDVNRKLTPLNETYQWSNPSSQDYKNVMKLGIVSSEIKTLLEKKIL
jgi:hypothetical protein